MKLGQVTSGFNLSLLEIIDKELIRDIQSCLVNTGYLDRSQIDGVAGEITLDAFMKFKEAYYLEHPTLLGYSTAQVLLRASKTERLLVTRYHFDRIFHNAKSSNRDKYFLPINKALEEFEINTLKRIAAFLAQVGHESVSLTYSEEIAPGFAYEGRKDLGNTVKGDGIRYKGRGLIQLTGRANYRSLGRALGADLENNPTLAGSQPLLAARIAGYFWQSRKLNELADQDDFRRITRKINGGYNGLEDRLTRWAWAKKVLGC